MSIPHASALLLRLSASALMGATLLSMPGRPAGAVVTAAAEGETCQGRSATIAVIDSDTDQLTVEGTPGDDVIVVDGGRVVYVAGGEGDDLICVRGRLPVEPFGDDSAVSGGPGRDSLELRLGSGVDHVEVDDFEKLDIEMGGGYDELSLFGVTGSGTIDGGPQGGNLIVAESGPAILVDLSSTDLLRTFSGAGRFTLTRIRDIVATARHVRIDGDGQHNRLRATGCRLEVSGGPGDDRIVASQWASAVPGCQVKRALLSGLKGNDLLVGSTGNDVLVGGPGRDTARGGRGRDTCRAEQRVSCER